MHCEWGSTFLPNLGGSKKGLLPELLCRHAAAQIDETLGWVFQQVEHLKALPAHRAPAMRTVVDTCIHLWRVF